MKLHIWKVIVTANDYQEQKEIKVITESQDVIKAAFAANDAMDAFSLSKELHTITAVEYHGIALHKEAT